MAPAAFPVLPHEAMYFLVNQAISNVLEARLTVQAPHLEYTANRNNTDSIKP